MAQQIPWWQEAVIYQIYPRSFQDSDGDGIGDLPGITRRLDYLEWLGITAIWLSPIYPSPMADFGYDVADFRGIHPLFGTLDDFDRLVAEAEQRGIRVILDLVPNHTSDQHPWFLEASSSRDNPYHDWFIWHPGGDDGGPPNNWRSSFGGPAWEWNEPTQEYYYHAYLPEQPDLEWRNPAVREAIYEVMRFWFDRGVAGFRIDVVWHLIVDDQLRDNPPNPDWSPGDPDAQEFLPVFTTDRPEVMAIVHEMRAVADEYDDNRLLIGEIYLPLERLVAYYGEEGGALHLPYNFQLVLTEWTAAAVGDVVTRYEGLLPAQAWPNWVLGNHDQPRVASRIGPEQARVAALLLLTLRGTPTIYYGDEIGMQNVAIPTDRIHDPVALTWPERGRDPERTPMQWSADGGFTAGVPWLPMADDTETVNVVRQRDDAASMLSLHRSLIAIRSASECLRRGSYHTLATEGDLFAYERRLDDERWIVAANFGNAAGTLTSIAATDSATIVLSTHLDRENEACSEPVTLRANEGVLIRLQ